MPSAVEGARLAGVHGSRTHPGRVNRPAPVLKTEEPTGTLPLPLDSVKGQGLPVKLFGSLGMTSRVGDFAGRLQLLSFVGVAVKRKS
jgi:hypothetical protein